MCSCVADSVWYVRLGGSSSRPFAGARQLRRGPTPGPGPAPSSFDLKPTDLWGVATLDIDPSIPLSSRLRRYADALDEEGRPDQASNVRAALRDYREWLTRGDPLAALAAVTALGLGVEDLGPERPR